MKDFFDAVIGEGFYEFAKPPRPDAIVHTASRRRGVELTSVIDQAEIEASIHEPRFFEQINDVLNKKQSLLPFRISLVMQDDRPHVVHKPAEGMEAYPLMSEWLDGVFMEHLADETAPKVVLNQRSSGRPSRGLFPPDKYVERFVDELIAYARSLDLKTDFTSFEGRLLHHGVTARMDSMRAQEGPRWLVKSLDKKLTDVEKYDRDDLERVDLLIHNYCPDSVDFRTVWHVYWHHMRQILGALATRSVNRTPGTFDDVFFLDYSQYTGSKAVVYRIGDGSVATV